MHLKTTIQDLGELEDLDDDAENALLGDSDEEGVSKSRERISGRISISISGAGDTRGQKEHYCNYSKMWSIIVFFCWFKSVVTSL